jgi:hypothetical protein
MNWTRFLCLKVVSGLGSGIRFRNDFPNSDPHPTLLYTVINYDKRTESSLQFLKLKVGRKFLCHRQVRSSFSRESGESHWWDTHVIYLSFSYPRHINYKKSLKGMPCRDKFRTHDYQMCGILDAGPYRPKNKVCCCWFLLSLSWGGGGGCLRGIKFDDFLGVNTLKKL